MLLTEAVPEAALVGRGCVAAGTSSPTGSAPRVPSRQVGGWSTRR